MEKPLVVRWWCKILKLNFSTWHLEFANVPEFGESIGEPTAPNHLAAISQTAKAAIMRLSTSNLLIEEIW
jgi:hypothetical protein